MRRRRCRRYEGKGLSGRLRGRLSASGRGPSRWMERSRANVALIDQLPDKCGLDGRAHNLAFTETTIFWGGRRRIVLGIRFIIVSSVFVTLSQSRVESCSGRQIFKLSAIQSDAMRCRFIKGIVDFPLRGLRTPASLSLFNSLHLRRHSLHFIPLTNLLSASSRSAR